MARLTRRQWWVWGLGGGIGLAALVGITFVGVMLSGWFVVNYAHLSSSKKAAPAVPKGGNTRVAAP